MEAAPCAQEAEHRRALDRKGALDAGTSPPKPFLFTRILLCDPLRLTVCRARPRACQAELVVKEPKAAPIHWFERQPSLPNKSEILALALLVLSAGKTVAVLDKWACGALSEEKRLIDLGAEYTMPDTPKWKATGNIVPEMFEPLSHAYDGGNWSTSALDQIGKAMQAWRGDGRVNGLTAGHLKDYIGSGVKGPGPKKKPKNGPPRWKTGAALINVAALVKRHGVRTHESALYDNRLDPICIKA